MSKIEVNAIEPQTGTTLTVGASGDTISLPTNVTLKTDTIQNTNSSTLITQTNATTITIGFSGATITAASGASQSGFGRTGTVNWDTTPKTTGFTAVSGNGYFIDTTSGAITVTLPVTPTAGDIVGITDYAGTAGTNNIIIGRNGSKIEGITENATLYTNRDTITLIYVDSTQGWLPISDNTGSSILPQFVTATGGTVTTCGNYKIHTFNSTGCFVVSNAGNAAGSNTVDYLVVAGGGAGGQGKAGNGGGSGGGAGGFRESKASGAPWTASPLASSTSLPVTAITYPVTVGAGGGPGSGCGLPGSNSIFSTITSAGGGGGGGGQSPDDGQPGGSGAGRNLGNVPPTSPPQGKDGGATGGGSAGGGGGAGEIGAPGTPNNYGVGGRGGAGVATSISGSSVSYAGGGGGGGYAGGPSGAPNAGGAGSPCGTGGRGNPIANGTTNRGGGGGGNGAGDSISNAPHGLGGSGVVVIRYKFQ